MLVMIVTDPQGEIGPDDVESPSTKLVFSTWGFPKIVVPQNGWFINGKPY